MSEIQVLIDSKPNIIFSDENQLIQYHPAYFDSVIRYIRKLGLVTEQQGHSQELDIQKNQAYKLIGL